MAQPTFEFITPAPCPPLSYGISESLFLVFEDDHLYGLGLIVPSAFNQAHTYFEKRFKTNLENRDDARAKNFGVQIQKKYPLSCRVMGTPFQHQVWKALLQIPEGHTQTYEDIAQTIQNPKAVRAVGSAIGHNPVSLLIPCHRVVPKSGGVGQFLWGSDVKEKLLKDEGSSKM
ncbi:O-6-methylguanine DNA methyltransferase family protein [Candidatus Bealeia paramacronuclearis]|uniref:O-6-methylguanine DNA methyltransferase family protein n=1 Tax=Candidatus Bealeia paramacronuclearis TaxID=1921001 RepID=A0ABZ2C766_9PROT|nr:O-6-methylguanine DNA methyltransferase family protein [Candidatus Bealeia paramacronuclearis]